MKTRVTMLLAVFLVACAIQGMAATLISKAQAEKDALAAVHGGTVILAVLDTNLGKKTWSVDIVGSTHEYEVWVDAHTGVILKIITQPLSPRSRNSRPQAVQNALFSVGAGFLPPQGLYTNLG